MTPENPSENLSAHILEKNPLSDTIDETLNRMNALFEKPDAIEDFLESDEFRAISLDNYNLIGTEPLLDKYRDQEDVLLDMIIAANEYIQEKMPGIRSMLPEDKTKVLRTNSILWKLKSLLEIRKRVRVHEALDRDIAPDDKYDAVFAMNLPENIENLLGENVQSGGGNAKGVFVIEGTNLVAVRKNQGAYPYSIWVPYFTSLFRNDPNIPRTYQVFRQEKYTYQVMERAYGVEMDKIPLEEIVDIPQEQFDQFVKRVALIESNGLMIDPSKSSNFFYDPEKGFSFIDLAVRGDNPYSALDVKVLTTALVKRKNWGDALEAGLVEKVHAKITLAMERFAQKPEV